jgi:hypothetical protein
MGVESYKRRVSSQPLLVGLSLSLSLLSIHEQSTFKEAAYPHDTSTVDS